LESFESIDNLLKFLEWYYTLWEYIYLFCEYDNCNKLLALYSENQTVIIRCYPNVIIVEHFVSKMPKAFPTFVTFAKMYYKMRLKVTFWTWYMNKSCTLWILDSLHRVRSMIAMNNVFV